jgi:hypothetical protein
LFRFAVGLKKLERRLPFIVKRGDLAIDNRLFDTQRFQGVDERGVIVAEIILLREMSRTPSPVLSARAR